MSHINSYTQIQIKDKNLFLEKAKETGATFEIASNTNGLTVEMFGSQKVDNAFAAIKFEGWRYPVALCNDGTLKYDHWGSPSSSIEHLHKAVQEYAKAHILNHLPLEASSHFVRTTKNEEVVIEINY